MNNLSIITQLWSRLYLTSNRVIVITVTQLQEVGTVLRPLKTFDPVLPVAFSGLGPHLSKSTIRNNHFQEVKSLAFPAPLLVSNQLMYCPSFPHHSLTSIYLYKPSSPSARHLLHYCILRLQVLWGSAE